MAHRILLVEDEIGIRVALEDRLRMVGYEVETATDGQVGLKRATEGGLDLIILDLILPGMDGLEVCRTLRNQGIFTPVLMLTAKTQLEEKLRGFSSGADDYVTKPFDLPELLARAKALLRRGMQRAEATPHKVHSFGDVEVDTKQSAVAIAGRSVPLSMKEYDLLLYFVTHPGETISREELLRAVWKSDRRTPTRTIDVHVGWLRKKIGDDPRNPRWIRTIYGVGYQFVAE